MVPSSVPLLYVCWGGVGCLPGACSCACCACAPMILSSVFNKPDSRLSGNKQKDKERKKERNKAFFGYLVEKILLHLHCCARGIELHQTRLSLLLVGERR